MLLSTEDITDYISFDNEDELEGYNLVKVWFANNGKNVASLLNETTMRHCSEILYENITAFDKDNLIGILQPNTVHNVVFADANGNIVGTVGSAKGSFQGASLFSYSLGDFEYQGNVNLDIKSSKSSKEKDNFNFGLLISKKTGKETGIIYQIFDSGQKIKVR